MKANSFPKSERLTKKNSIKELFEKGSSFYLYPFKVLFIRKNGDGHQLLVSVSKKNFKRAVDRNLLKRRIREAYRLNKGIISGNKSFQIAYIYTATELLDFHKIQQKLILTLKKLENEKEN